MFNILWIEDEVGWVEDLAPILARMPGISLTVLLLDTADGVKIPGIRIIEIPRDHLTIEIVSQHVLDAVSRYHPWLVITDLKLDPLLEDPEVYAVGALKAAGINLTLRLSRHTDCRRVVWLTNYGLQVLSNIRTLVISTWPHGQVKVISFPKTYVVTKNDCIREVPDLIEFMTKQAVKQLLESKATYRIQGSRIERLFRLLSTDSIAHYFTKPAAHWTVQPELFEKAKNRLGNHDLITNDDEPLSLATWLMAWYPEGPQVETVTPANAREFADHLVNVLGKSLWGMTVQELPELLNYAALKHHVDRTLFSADQIDLVGTEIPEATVIGPIARELLVIALGNSLENACRYGNGAKLFLGSHVTARALYLVVANEVANLEETVNESIRKGQNQQLRGVYYINSTIDQLNQLHEHQRSRVSELDGWGSWGFATIGWDNQKKRARSLKSEAFCAGSLRQQGEKFEESVVDIYSILGNKFGKSGVMSVFHLPLVRLEDLAQRTPSHDPLERALRMTS